MCRYRLLVRPEGGRRRVQFKLEQTQVCCLPHACTDRRQHHIMLSVMMIAACSIQPQQSVHTAQVQGVRWDRAVAHLSAQGIWPSPSQVLDMSLWEPSERQRTHEATLLMTTQHKGIILVGRANVCEFAVCLR